MRTTLTLDPDVARMIEDAVHRVRKPRKDVVNEALRRGLTSSGPGRPRKGPRIDRGRLSTLADELEADALLGETPVRRKRA